MTRLNALCLLGLFLGLAAPAVAAPEGFEGGLGIWAPSGLWQRVVSPACVTPFAGTAAMYFGRSSCDYADGQLKDAALTSGPVLLGGPATAYISFWMSYQVESLDPLCYDRLRLERSADGANWALLQELSTAVNPAGSAPTVGLASGSGLAGPPLWVFKSVDLSAYAGSTQYLRFRFVSAASQAGNPLCGAPDPDFDGFLGYALDEISFGGPPPMLSLAKSVAPPFAAPGDTFTYSLSVRNLSPVAQALDVWDSLPAGLGYLGSDSGGVFSAGLVHWALPSVAAGATALLQVWGLAPPGPVDLFNHAAAQGAGPEAVPSGPVLARVRANGLSVRKLASRSRITSGDRVEFTLLVENFSAVTQSALSLQELLPPELTVERVHPNFNNGTGWALAPLPPGGVAAFSLYCRGYGRDGQVFSNTARLFAGGALQASASVSITVDKPFEPHLALKGIYPNPAPSDKPGLPQAAFFVYEINQAMPVIVDIYDVAGTKVRRLSANGEKGLHEAAWDLNNDAGLKVASGIYLVRVWSNYKTVPTPEAYGYLAVQR